MEAYDAARFQDAIRLWLAAGPYDSLAPDTLYNIGNASYRLGSPGHAALYFRRALERDPTHAEARQNLRFIERKVGAITVKRPEYQYLLAHIPLTTWQGATAAAGWLVLLGLLVFPATRPGSPLRIAAIAAFVLAPILGAAGALGWRYYPDDAQFAPPDRQAVIVAPDAVLFADASRTAPEVIDAPPGSLCEIVRERGRWAYVAFSSGTRGWVPTEWFERVHPRETPDVPEIRKPRADGSSA